MPVRRARPMPEDDFWVLIALLEGRPVGEPVHRLAAELERRGSRTSRAFAERLALVLFDLDREVLADRTIRWADAPDEEPVPLSDDSFLYLRAAVVAAGRQAVAAAVADPASLEGRLWDDGEELLSVAGDHETSVSYETGSNDQHWSPRPDDAPTVRPVVALVPRDALDTIEGWDGDGTPTVWEMSPRWLDEGALWRVADDLTQVVLDGGGLPDDGLDQLVVVLRFAQEPPAPPVVRGRVRDEFGGVVTESLLVVDHARARTWAGTDLELALGACAARALAACLPDDHGGRAVLQARVAAGEHLLTTA